ncbi:baseplate assembly protein [Clostridium cylindrosporum]|uniref:Phage-like baseplate assembly protein n=1 Tax=Clostridium cylindrosporum DSM 605 TaxID=1121307 RepID=A0A0J8G5Y4_CLOCY|nr:baseplate J/gp47 family protein [Clostridium cylindrosporum]KMT23016.1 phage-like baseplate assembly protein [Clostridium cylindrosporum DSM 605]
MSDIQFVEVDSSKIQSDLINSFEEALGETLYPSDERRIFLQQEVQVIVGLKNDINDSAKQNLLRYARGQYLEALGEPSRTERLPAQRAKAPFKYSLSELQTFDVLIPKGSRVSPDGELYFETIADAIVKAGTKDIETVIIATDSGEKYNDFEIGQIKILVDPIPYVESGINTGISFGGADIEDDDRYRERIRLAPESFSTTGPEGAYKYYAKSADLSISDVAVTSPSPGVVRLTVLCKDGAIPQQGMLDKVLSICSDRSVRPLTDKVEVGPPSIKTYDITLTYYLDREYATQEGLYRQAIEGENGAIKNYISWQQECLGRDISVDELRYKIQDAAVYYDSNNIKHTAVRRVQITLPIATIVGETEVAKVGLVSVVYGGLE